MTKLWMMAMTALVAAGTVPVALAGNFGYTFDCDGATVDAAGTTYEILVSRHQVPNSADVLYFIQVTVPMTDIVVEEELFFGVDNFIPWAADDKIVNPDFDAAADTDRIHFWMEGAQTGKSVSGHGDFVVDGRAYTFVAWPKTSLF